MTTDDDGLDRASSDLEQAHSWSNGVLSDESWCHLFPDLPDVIVHQVVEDCGPVTRQVRGRKMRTMGDAYDEFAAAWQFEDYGEGSAHLDEDLLTLHLAWPSATGFAMVILEPEQVLKDDPSFAELVEILKFVHTRLAAPVAASPPTGRGALSFDVVLVTDAEHRDEVVRRWRAAGAPIGD